MTLIRDFHQPAFCFLYLMTGSLSEAAKITEMAFARREMSIDSCGITAERTLWFFSTLYRVFLSMEGTPQKNAVSLLDHHFYRNTPNRFTTVNCHTLALAYTTLQPDLRAPLALFYINKLSCSDIAKILEIPMKTLQARISKGKTMLHQRMEFLHAP